MSAIQRGQVQKHKGSWSARWYDLEGRRCRKSFGPGREGKEAASTFLEQTLRELEAVRRGETLAASDRPQTLDALAELFLERHGRTVDPATKRKLSQQLRQARDEFGARHPDGLNRIELEDWREQLSPGSRPDVFRAFRQMLVWGLARGLVARDPTVGIRNPKRKRHERREIRPFETWQELETIADELDPRYSAIPIFAASTGLRPEEWIALERTDLDRESGLVRVRRRFSGGELKPGGKTAGSIRSVPLSRRVLEALERVPKRIDTTLLFPAPRGGHIDLERFRDREWKPALLAGGVEHRSPYALRHTFATWAIEDGRLSLIELARLMGTSVRELEDTYFRWLDRTDDRVRTVFEDFGTRAVNGGQ